MPRAVVCREHGPPEKLRVEEVALSEPGPGQARVEVRAASVNYADLLILENRYQMRAAVPFTPGSELAGIVRAVGPGVDGLRPGEAVSAQLFVGAFAEQVLLDARAVVRLPDGVDFRSAACLSVTYGTAYAALRSVARLERGETLVVLGAAGGVGLAAVELGVRMGARVIAAASSPEKLRACLEHGASAGIDYAAEDLKERIRELTGGAGADVVLDPVGGPYAEPALRATGWKGRYVVLGFAAGEIPRIPLNLVLLKGSSILGFTIGQFVAREPEEARRNQAELVQMLARGELRPRVSAVYPLEETPQALRDVASRRAIGKVVIEP